MAITNHERVGKAVELLGNSFSRLTNSPQTINMGYRIAECKEFS